MRVFLLLSFLFTTLVVSAQEVKHPKTIKEAVVILQTDAPEDLKVSIKKTSDDSLITLVYPWGGKYKAISDWTSKKSKLNKHFAKKGIAHIPHQQTVLLVAFRRELLGQQWDESEILKPYKLTEQEWAIEDKNRLTKDSLRGFYIPKDLNDAFVQIDGFWNDSSKVEIKNLSEDEFIGRTHFGFGMWMRNNWQLWGGSRLSRFFNNLGVYHPDDISGIILVSYHRYLSGKDIKLEEQIKYYQDFWEKAKKQKN